MKKGLVVNIIVEKDGKIIALMRNFKPKGKIDILGGLVGKEETVEKAAVREAREESGYEVRLIKKIGVFEYLYQQEEKESHVFIAEIIRGRLKSSIEGKPFWINIKRIDKRDLAFPQLHIRVIEAFIDYQKKQL